MTGVPSEDTSKQNQTQKRSGLNNIASRMEIETGECLLSLLWSEEVGILQNILCMVPKWSGEMGLKCSLKLVLQWFKNALSKAEKYKL